MLVNPLCPDISRTYSPPGQSVLCDPDSQMLVNSLCPDISQTYSPATQSFPVCHSQLAPRAPCVLIARTHGCVRNDSEMHMTVLLDCTTGEAGSAIQ